MDKIIQLLTSPKICTREADMAFMMSLMMSFKHGQIAAFSKQVIEQCNVPAKCYSMDQVTGNIYLVDSWEITDADLPENSVAVLYMEGMVFPWKTFDLEQRLLMIDANPRIVATLLFINTPGGYIHRVDSLADTIRSSVKPVVSHVTGMCCSAGLWMIAPSDRIFLASQLDTVGSLGTMTTYMNDQKFWEQMGIEMKDIYATESDLKNKPSRIMDENQDDSLIVQDLDFYNNIFQQTIAGDLEIPFDPKSHVFRGATFHGQDAISVGLAHEIGSLEVAINYALNEGLKVQANNSFK